MSRRRVTERELRLAICALIQQDGPHGDQPFTEDRLQVQRRPESPAWCNWDIPPTTIRTEGCSSRQIRAIRLAIAAAREQFNVDWAESTVPASPPGDME